MTQALPKRTENTTRLHRLPRFKHTAAAACALAALAGPAAANQFITSDRTVAGGNPLNGTYLGQTLLVGASAVVNGEVQRVGNVRVDVTAPAHFTYNDQTGGGVAAYSNSVVRVTGGLFDQNSANGFGGGVNLSDTASARVEGGTMRFLALNGAAAGAAGAQATVTGGLIQNGLSGVGVVTNGVLNVSGGTLRSTGGQGAITGARGSVINVSGGSMESALGAAVYLAEDSTFTMTGGTLSGGPSGRAQWGLRTQHIAHTALLQGGTINGGVRTMAFGNTHLLQATLSGNMIVNGGVFAYNNAAVDVHGGNYTRYAGADASFFAMGLNTINFYGTGLALSGPTAGSVFETNNYQGNFYTFTGGTFAGGQSAVGLRIFDATSVAGTQLGGGFVLNTAPVPEPATWLMMGLALPALAAVARRQKRQA
jgi:PEP-CTERM motif